MREREWEAAHTFWLWPDLSPSMDFQSHLSPRPSATAALVLMLAAAELLVRGGERVALLGLTPPLASRKATTRSPRPLAATGSRAAVEPAAAGAAQPLLGRDAVQRFPRSPETIAERLNELARGGVQGHLVQMLDPAEETLPYEGRTEFLAPEGGERWIADRVETLRADYRRGSPRIAPGSRSWRAGSAGRSWCITPTGPRRSRC